jgi:hypothetical protein
MEITNTLLGNKKMATWNEQTSEWVATPEETATQCKLLISGLQELREIFFLRGDDCTRIQGDIDAARKRLENLEN